MDLTNAKIRSDLGKNWFLFLIMGIFSVIAGIYFTMNFGEGFEYIAFMVSIYFLVSGIMSLCIAIQYKGKGWLLNLILAIISFIAGIMIITDYYTSWFVSISGLTVVIFCGIGYISEAISLISIAIAFRKQIGSSWILTLILGIMLLISACSIAANPLLLMTLININVSVSAFTFGITSIITAFQLKKMK